MSARESPEMLVAHDGPVVVICWTGSLTVAGVRGLHVKLLTVQPTSPEGLAVVHVTSRTATLSMPSDDTYAALMDVVDDEQLRVLAIGAVLRSDGVGAAIVRTGLSTAMLLARRASQYTCVATTDEVDRWLDRGPVGLLPGFRRGAVDRALESLREPLGERASEFLDPPRTRRRT